MTGVAAIKNVIPQRYPILLLDRVLEVVPGERLRVAKAITSNEACYGRVGNTASDRDYRYPPSLILESWAQAGVLLATWDDPNPDVLAGKAELAGAINEVRFGAPVYPGDVLEHRVRMVKVLGDTVILAGETVVGETTVMEVGQFVKVQKAVDELRPQSPVTAQG